MDGDGRLKQVITAISWTVFRNTTTNNHIGAITMLTKTLLASILILPLVATAANPDELIERNISEYPSMSDQDRLTIARSMAAGLNPSSNQMDTRIVNMMQCLETHAGLGATDTIAEVAKGMRCRWAGLPVNLTNQTSTQLTSTTTQTPYNQFQTRGHVRNSQGQQCTYTQRTDNNNTYFFGHPSRTGIITFDDPMCMSPSELGLNANKSIMNNVISRWHSQPDAGFRTRAADLTPGLSVQRQGYCIQSARYPLQGIAIDYDIRNGSIARIKHTSSPGCSGR